MWVDGSQMGSVEYSDRRIRTMKIRMIIMIRRMITMIMIIVKWSFRGLMCNFEYSTHIWASGPQMSILYICWLFKLYYTWAVGGAQMAVWDAYIWDVCLFGVIKIQKKTVCFLFVSVMCLLEKRLDSLLGGRLGWLVGGGWYQIEPAGRGLNWTLGPSWGSLVMVDNFQRYGYAGYSYWDPKDDFPYEDVFANQFILTLYYD